MTITDKVIGGTRIKPTDPLPVILYDVNGGILFSASNPAYVQLAAGSAAIGAVAQGAAGVAEWLMSDATARTRLASIITLLAGGLPAALVSGRLDVNVGADPAFAAVAGGTKVGATTSATQLASTTCRLVRIKAAIANTGNIYLGPSGVTTAGANAYTELAPGDDTGWIPVSNANLLYHIASTGTQNFFWWAL
ncbi:MAG: hypothetical protein NTZ05_20245 [Chloroflexi bacterium]|nr:hypothetical protein [Chloroflexota bacterium]